MNKDLFNIDILVLKEENLAQLGEVTTGSIFEPSSNVFNKKGLFSLETFGQLGTSDRMERYGYINLRVPVLHPLVYKQLTDLKGLYKEIMAGNKRVKWDNTIKDFVLAKEGQGETGYTYFLKYVDKIKWSELD